MKKFAIQVTETCDAWFVVEAETQADAIRTLNAHSDEVSEELEKWCNGWTYKVSRANPDDLVDFTAENKDG